MKFREVKINKPSEGESMNRMGLGEMIKMVLAAVATMFCVVAMSANTVVDWSDVSGNVSEETYVVPSDTTVDVSLAEFPDMTNALNKVIFSNSNSVMRVLGPTFPDGITFQGPGTILMAGQTVLDKQHTHLRRSLGDGDEDNFVKFAFSNGIANVNPEEVKFLVLDPYPFENVTILLDGRIDESVYVRYGRNAMARYDFGENLSFGGEIRLDAKIGLPVALRQRGGDIVQTRDGASGDGILFTEGADSHAGWLFEGGSYCASDPSKYICFYGDYMYFRQTRGLFSVGRLAIRNDTPGYIRSDFIFAGTGAAEIRGRSSPMREALFAFADSAKFRYAADANGCFWNLSRNGNTIWAHNGGVANYAFHPGWNTDTGNKSSAPTNNVFAFDGGMRGFSSGYVDENGAAKSLFGHSPTVKIYENGGGILFEAGRRWRLSNFEVREPEGNVVKSIAMSDELRNMVFQSPPSVEIYDPVGNGTNAAAIVDYDFDTGRITNISIVCKGENYSTEAKANLRYKAGAENRLLATPLHVEVGPEWGGDFVFASTNFGAQAWLGAVTNYTHGALVVDMDRLGLVDGNEDDGFQASLSSEGCENTVLLRYRGTSVPIPRFENCSKLVVRSGCVSVWSGWGFNHNHMFPNCFNLELYGGHLSGGTLAATNVVVGGTTWLTGHKLNRAYAVSGDSAPYSCDLNITHDESPNVWRTVGRTPDTPGTLVVDVDSPNGPAILRAGKAKILASDQDGAYVGGGSVRFGGTSENPSTLTVKNFESLKVARMRRVLLDLSDPNLVVAGTNNVVAVTPSEIADYGRLDWSAADRKLYWEPAAPIFTIEDGVLVSVNLNGASDVIIPNSVTNIGGGAFTNCDGMISVVVPSSISLIGSGTFAECSMLREVVFDRQDGPICVGVGAFSAGTSVVMRPDIGYAFAGWVDAGGNMVDLNSIATGCVSVWPSWKVLAFVDDVVAKQRYPWNGLVDITCRVHGIEGETNGFRLAVSVMMPDSGRACNVSHFWVIQDNVTDSSSREVYADGDYRLVWDARADLGAVRYTNMVVCVNIDTHDNVRLWEDGPYWATANIGAEEPWESGCYFWWGDTVGCKREGNAWIASDGSAAELSFDEDNVPTCGKDIATLQDERWIAAGNALAPEHDAAQMQWGGGWRMPTYKELYDLCYNKCDWTWTSMNGVNGYVVRGRGKYADSSIFLPCAGYGCGPSLMNAGSSGMYCSSLPDAEGISDYMLDISFGRHYLWRRQDFGRCAGKSIRPVKESVPRAGESAPFCLDTDEGLRIARATEPIAYSTEWDGCASVRIAVDGVSLMEAAAPATGDVLWNAAQAGEGSHTLMYTAGGAACTARFVVLGDGAVAHGGPVGADVEWLDDSVHLVSRTIIVPSGVTLTIAPGAIVKFMDGAGIVCETGGRCVADGVIFTHVNDDTAGGDTLLDGSTAPLTDMYVLDGVSGNESTQYRYYSAHAIMLGGTIYKDAIWHDFNIYCVTDDVTVAYGVTLTVEPGAVVKFAAGKSLTVNSGAALNAIGTRAQPIVFTSIKDDVYGGDTNKDGDKTLPGPADWGCVLASGGTVNANYCRFTYGSGVDGNQYGARACVFMLNDSSGSFDNCLFGGSMMDGCFAENATFRNCIFTDCGRGLVSHSGAVTAINCVAAYNGIGFFSHTSPLIVRNSISSLNEESAITGDGGSRETSNCYFGDDPKFIDPDKGDYRIDESSPCVDAADAAYAPETDYFGQPRVNAPDIGICEVMPRGTTSDIDLLPQSVTADAEAVSGQMLTVNWTVSNKGGSDVEDSWRDTISLVSANGSEIVLGEKVIAKRLVAGGTISCSAVFTVPAIAEGTWYPKVKVNTYRDVFEGALTDNNAMTGDNPVKVMVAAVDVSSSVSGTIIAGVPTVLKLPFAEDMTNRLVRMALPEGVSASWGFGFMPQGLASSGTAVASGNDVCFLAPDGEQAVYVVLESGTTADYSLTFEEFALRINTVSPSVVKYGEKRFVIATGTGFTSDTKLVLSAGAYSEEVSCSILSTSEVMFYLDATKYTSGTIINVKAQNDTVSSSNDGVVTIVDNVGEGDLRFELDLPETARAKRISIGYVEYGNVGNADMVVPILNIVGNGGTVVSLTSHSETFSNSCTIVGVSMRPPHGMLKAGETVRLPFYFIPGEEYSISLEVLNADNLAERDSVFPTWKAYCEGMSEAATLECVSGHIVYDFAIIYERAMRMAYEQDTTSLSGYLYNRVTALPMSGETLLLTDTNYTVVATSVTDTDGFWTFRDLPANERYEVIAKTCNLSAQTELVSGRSAGAVNLMAMPFCTFVYQLNNIAKCDLERASMCAINQNGEITLAQFTPDGKAVFCSMPDGVYEIAFKSDDWCCVTGKNEVVISTGEIASENHASSLDILPSGIVNLSLIDANNSCVFSNVVCSLVNQDGGIVAYGITDQDGRVRFDAPSGTYGLAVGTKLQFYEEIKIDVAKSIVTERVVSASAIPFEIEPSVGSVPLQTVFTSVNDGIFGADFSCEWDFNGDGVFDSFGIIVTNVYTDAGTYSVGLRVTTSDGRVFNYQKRDAVMAWESLPTKMNDGTFTLDDDSGYMIVSSTDEAITLRELPDQEAIILEEGDIIVDPNQPLAPRKISSITNTDSGDIIVETEFVELNQAYHTLTLSSPIKLMSYPTLERETGNIKDINPSLKINASIISGKGQVWVKNGSYNLYLVDGKIRIFQCIFDSKLKVEAGIDVKVGGSAQKITYWALGYIGPRMKCSGHVKSQVSYETSWKHICYTKYNMPTKKDCDVKISGSTIEGAPKLEFKGSIDATLGMELEAGIGVIDPKKDRKATIADLKFGLGVKVKAGVDLSASETEPDKYYYSWGPYANWELNLLHVKAEWLGWEWDASVFSSGLRDFKIKWNCGDDWKWRTPLPKLQIENVGNYNNGKVPVTFESTTSVPYDSVLKTRSWEGCCKGSGESCTASLRARKQDTVAYDVILRETYAPKKLDFSILNSAGLWRSKLAKKRITVTGPESDDAKNFEVVRRGDQIIIKSKDPNEMAGPMGKGNPETQRFLEPGQRVSYTVYYENDPNATAAAQEVFVANSLSQYLDWSTFEMGEVAFGDQIDLGLVGKQCATNEVTMTGTNLIVRTIVNLDKEKGEVHWYQRVIDPDSGDTWPADVTGGFLPPNDKETHCGEGHLTYFIKVRDDAPRGVRIDNSATIVFDTEDPIETDPAWWNLIATHQDVSMTVDGVATNLDLIVGMPYGELPTPSAWAGHTFGGWHTEPNGTGRQITSESLVEAGDSGLYPYWTANEYVVAFNANGGEGEMPNQTNTYDVVACLASNAFVFAGHKFVGWATNETDDAIYADGAVVSNLTAEANGVVDLFAVWGNWDVNFVDAEIAADEGSNVAVRVYGGNNGSAASMKLYLTYNTAATADIDLKKGAVDGVTPKGGLKFPLTLSWAVGEIGEKVITIPVKADKTVEDDEFLTLQLADAVGMELGEERVCTVTIHDPGYDALAAKIKAGTATKAEKTAWEKLQKAKAPYIRGLADSAERGKVTGSGLCAAGKKVTLKATANKGFVFVGWTDSQIALDGDRLLPNAVKYVATTPSLVIDRSAKPGKSTATSTTITGVDEDATYYACFITSDEDKAAMGASVDGLALDPWVSKTETHALKTNIWAGVYLEWPIATTALSETTVKVAGLPTGLKFAAKPVTSKVGTGKTAVTVTNVQANTIYGAPSAASKTTTDKKTGKATVTPSEVKVTVTTAGKSSQTYQIDTVVDALPSWAFGTFNGGWDPEGAATSGGQVSLTVSAAGKVSGKALGDGLTYTLAAPYYSGFAAIDDGDGVSSNFLADITASWSYKEGNKTVKANEVIKLTVQDNGIGGYAAVDDWFKAYTVNWKVEPWKTLGKKFDKQTRVYAILSDGTFSESETDLTSALGAEVTGRVTLKFAAGGTVSVSGEFVTGYDEKKQKYTTVKATGSATLVPVDEGHGEVFIYLTPKGLAPHARYIEVPWPQE